MYVKIKCLIRIKRKIESIIKCIRRHIKVLSLAGHEIGNEEVLYSTIIIGYTMYIYLAILVIIVIRSLKMIRIDV
tara:strand:+ start:40 stop:264 length:225 start_codon:yes stop_codon:yes gene_type:complete